MTLIPPFAIYDNLNIGDANGHVCSCDDPDIARVIHHALILYSLEGVTALQDDVQKMLRDAGLDERYIEVIQYLIALGENDRLISARLVDQLATAEGREQHARSTDQPTTGGETAALKFNKAVKADIEAGISPTLRRTPTLKGDLT